MNLSQTYECRNWESEHYNSFLEITRLHSFISGNTLLGPRHLYWILAGPSFAVQPLKDEGKTMFSIPYLVCSLVVREAGGRDGVWISSDSPGLSSGEYFM
jgi:hypothetical protein